MGTMSVFLPMVKLAPERPIQWYGTERIHIFTFQMHRFYETCSCAFNTVYLFLRVGLIYCQKKTGGSITEHYMIFFKSLRAGKVPLHMKLVFKWLRYTMNKFVIYSQAMVIRKDILHFYSFRFLFILGYLTHGWESASWIFLG